ncbi:MAG: hypothetical protein K8U03_06635 [Planctomycetia bacterium]|nr:hypothetical protein [Planctomycetia bacterium]
MNRSTRITMTMTIEIDGHEHRCSRFSLRDYIELERRFAAMKPYPLVVARAHLDGLPETLQRHLLELAFEKASQAVAPTVEELRRWLLGNEGLSVALELSLRGEHSLIAAERCRRKVYEAEGSERCELLRMIEAATGMRLREGLDLGNVQGRSAMPCASAHDRESRPQVPVEPEWIGEPYATD